MGELGLLLIGGACVIVAVAIIPTLIEVRKTLVEAKVLLELVNSEMVPLLREIRAVSEHINTLADRATGGVEQASVLFDAMGELGRKLQSVQRVVEQRGTSMAVRVAILGAGMKAAAGAWRHRWQRQRSASNGR